MAFKDDSIPEGYPQNGQYNWTKDKCTSKIWIKSKKVYNNSNKSIICWSIFIVAVILLGFVVFIYFVKYVAKNIEVYKTVHSSVIPKQLVSQQFLTFRIIPCVNYLKYFIKTL